MSAPEPHTLIDALPDLVLLIRRDGVLLSHVGGSGVAALIPESGDVGQRLGGAWPPALGTLVKQLVRRAIAERNVVEAPFADPPHRYDLRAHAQGPDRAICVVRAAAAPTGDDTLASTGEHTRPELDRRGFLRRFNQTLALAAIQEKAAAVAIIQLDGIGEIARVVDSKVSEHVLTAALLRLPRHSPRTESRHSVWYLGQLSETLLALVIETSDRDEIERCLALVCAALREPVSIGDAEFHLTPYCGVAILGQDSASPKNLLDQARSAAAEARRSGSQDISFFTDSLRLRSLARLDVARELRAAIDNGDIGLRYVGRHDLVSGRLVTEVGYLHWRHPLRGEVRPAEFLSVAATTGLATVLSRTVLRTLSHEMAAGGRFSDSEIKLSFGPLRHHLLQEDFVADVERLLADGMPATRLELRISERSFVSIGLPVLDALHGLGVRIIVDEVGRGLGSLDRLARAPLWGLQLDRAWVTALPTDAIAVRVCRAGINAAAALGLEPIATGVDDERRRQALVAIGCGQGCGDLYPRIHASESKVR